MPEYSDEIKAVYKYISDLMADHGVPIYKVNYDEYLDLYYGSDGGIRIRIESSVAISQYTEAAWEGKTSVWKLLASVELGDPGCFEKLEAALARVI